VLITFDVTDVQHFHWHQTIPPVYITKIKQDVCFNLKNANFNNTLAPELRLQIMLRNFPRIMQHAKHSVWAAGCRLLRLHSSSVQCWQLVYRSRSQHFLVNQLINWPNKIERSDRATNPLHVLLTVTCLLGFGKWIFFQTISFYDFASFILLMLICCRYKTIVDKAT
jgi:hypothetical protein